MNRPRDFTFLYLALGLIALIAIPMWFLEQNLNGYSFWFAMFCWLILMPIWIFDSLDRSHTRFGEYIGPRKLRRTS